MTKQLHILILTLVLLAGTGFAQITTTPNQQQQPSTDEQLAAQYYQSGDFEKASVYYEKLYNKNPIAIYYSYYLNCLIFTKEYKKAEKLVKKQSSRNPVDLKYRVDMGRVYRASGDEVKAKKEFDGAINSISSTVSSGIVIDLANAFLGINETEYAVKAYQQGRKSLKGVYSFNIELAEVYSIRKEYEWMVNEYLDMLEINLAFRQQVQNNLQARMDEDAEDKVAPLLKAELIRRTQKDPDKIIWSEMLMWFYMQQKNFSQALIQAKAIDKRKKWEGNQVVDLAEIARSNGEYDVAIDAYDYIIGLGADKSNFRLARTEKINTKYEKVTLGGIYTNDDLLLLKTEMNATLDELGRDPRTIKLQRSLAHLEAFYLYNTKDAVSILEKAISIPGISPMQQAECKLELGDVLLLDGQVWEASLRYSQVEKAFKFEPIGQEAKYRNAKVAFYIGDFEWAQVQLDVLKGATSKLISNDAMYLSMLITENLALDSNPDPLMRFAHADLMVFQNRFDQALLELDSLDKEYPTHALSDDVLYMRYRIAYKQQKWNLAADYLSKIISNYSYDVLADDAYLRLAELYDTKLNDKARAMQYYQELFVKFPGSTFAVDARKRYRVLRGDKVSE
jgi:tetratricopeptide (TPR) repeat protein